MLQSWDSGKKHDHRSRGRNNSAQPGPGNTTNIGIGPCRAATAQPAQYAKTLLYSSFNLLCCFWLPWTHLIPSFETQMLLPLWSLSLSPTFHHILHVLTMYPYSIIIYQSLHIIFILPVHSSSSHTLSKSALTNRTFCDYRNISICTVLNKIL